VIATLISRGSSGSRFLSSLLLGSLLLFLLELRSLASSSELTGKYTLELVTNAEGLRGSFLGLLVVAACAPFAVLLRSLVDAGRLRSTGLSISLITANLTSSVVGGIIVIITTFATLSLSGQGGRCWNSATATDSMMLVTAFFVTGVEITVLIVGD
jgi:hypothetical protein